MRSKPPHLQMCSAWHAKRNNKEQLSIHAGGFAQLTAEGVKKQCEESSSQQLSFCRPLAGVGLRRRYRGKASVKLNVSRSGRTSLAELFFIPESL